mmetsp:Transcript_39027/g.37346  ORF Transcript_39027/g.37346 Transcript_39027/m.37346 type:complete len:82 (-) Transcript_39027:815-1060(-)
MGNIIGSFLTSMFTETFGFPWYTAYALVATFCTVFAVIVYFLAEPHPEDVGVHIIEISEALIEQEKYLERAIQIENEEITP